jgi:peptide/nickel transport system ATP-binding protein
MSEALLTVTDLTVTFNRRGVAPMKAVDGVSFSVAPGQTVGLVGESGCGKSTFGRALLQLEELTEGSVTLSGVDLATLKGEDLRRQRRHMQMVFQDPLGSLDPRQTVEQLLLEGMQAHGLASDKKGARDRLVELLDAVGLPASALSKYPHEFSGGQRQRVGIARALSVDPELIVADEPVSALDVSVQAQVINLLQDLQEEFGLTYLVIAHDLAVVRHISDRIGVMYLGALVEEAEADDLYAMPLHPYTRALLSAIPVPDPVVEDTRERILLSGDLPSPANPPSGCRFHTRCPWAQQTRCSTERPALRQVTIEVLPGSHRVACHFAEGIASGEIQRHAVEAVLTEPTEAPEPAPHAVPGTTLLPED